jgi:glycosyltransferase involved in cell wall biosynthesis
MVGDGSLTDPLRNLIATHKLQDMVSVERNVPHDQVPALLESAYGHICSSIVEGFNVTTLEAALYGVPTIGSNVAGVYDFVEQGVTGLLFEENDADGLAACMKRLDSDSKLRDRLGKDAFSAAQRYTITRTTDTFEKIVGTLPRRML